MSSFVRSVVEAMASVVPAGSPLHAPVLAGNEWVYVKECLDTGWVSSVGAYVDRFEAMLAEITGARAAVATASGTAALHACLMLAGVRPGDEVMVPSITFVATANAVSYCGAIPHFVDSSPDTMGIDPRRLAEYLEGIADRSGGTCVNRLTGRPIRAVVGVHIFGHPLDLDALLAVCERFGLVLVEDAAESLGSYYKGRHTGNHGRLASLSFNGNKIVTTGGGGAILTNDPELGKAAKHLTTTAKLPHRWEFDHDQVGYNYRLPNVNAAIGCAQLELLPRFIAAKRTLAESYRDALAGVPGIAFFGEPSFARSNYWLNLFLLDRDHVHERDALLAALNDAGLMSRPAWRPMHRLKPFQDCPRMEMPVADDLYARLINIPSGADLGPVGVRR